MAKLQYQCTMSLDGYIAGPGGSADWMVPYLGPDPAVEQVMKRTGALLVGRTTFGGSDPFADTENEGEPYGGGWEGRQFVLTHRPPQSAPSGVTFVGDLAQAVAAAKEAAGDKNVGVLGASVAAQCLDAGLLDEVVVCVAPLFLGDGVHLFERAGGAQVHLERISVNEGPKLTSLVFRVAR